jgi:hypothetical protein
VAVPIVGVIELAAHVAQTSSVAPDRDWKAAREVVAAEARPEDLVVFAPRWTDPVGRELFGPRLATVEREARPDESRFPRAFEVAIRGAHDPSLAGWRRAAERRFGAVTVTTWENPSPVRVLDDLVSLVTPERLHVSHVEGGGAEADCALQRGAVSSGGLGFGPAIPSVRFACPGGGPVTPVLITDTEYHARRCIYAPPPGGSGALRLRFSGVRFGRALHGHHGLYVEAERDRKGAPVTLTWRLGSSASSVLGSLVHRDGDGWKGFELDTSALAGQVGDLVAEVSAPSGDRRMYCFEADTQ